MRRSSLMRSRMWGAEGLEGVEVLRGGERRAIAYYRADMGALRGDSGVERGQYRPAWYRGLAARRTKARKAPDPGKLAPLCPFVRQRKITME